MKSPEVIGRIKAESDTFGVFAPSLKWNQNSLDRIAIGANLRTNITIHEGEARGKAQYENMGETLAWKRFSNPFDSLRIGVDKDGKVETTPIYLPGQANLILNHQIIRQEVMEKSTGRFDEKLYAQALDSLTRQGVNNILAREKLTLALISGTRAGISLTGLGLMVGISYLCSRGTFTDLFLSPPTGALEWDAEALHPYINYYGYRVVEGMVGGVTPLIQAGLLAMIDWGYVLKARRSNDPYGRGFNDLYNPLKHLKDYMAGFVALKTGPSLVTDQS